MDELQQFAFQNMPIRGEIVHLNKCYDEIMLRHAYPLPAQKLLGQMLVSASLLSATLNYKGSLIIQVHGDGPVSLLVAQANFEQHIRGLAKSEDKIPEDFVEAIGKGRLAITIDPGSGPTRYQGIVELRGVTLAQTLENYFYQSEQIPTFLFLAADEKSAAGFLLQLLESTEETKNYWEHLDLLAKTLTSDELLNLDNKTILHRLFHQENVELFSPKPVKFLCSCSRDAMADAILTMGKKEAVELAEKNKIISVTCEFCNKQSDFDRIDIERIFYGKNII